MPEDHECSEKEKIANLHRLVISNEGRLHAGDILLAGINTALIDINSAQTVSKKQQDEIYRRMFVDNGKKSIQSTLSNTGVHIRLQWFFIGAIMLAIIGGTIKLWFMMDNFPQ